MLFKNTLNKLVLMTAVITVSAFAQTPYDEGQEALRAQRWMEAANQFEKAIEAESTKADEVPASMYWRAHALYKAGHRGDAARQVQQLERQHESSRWLDEAKALQVEYGGSIDDASEEDELRLFALSQLLERDFDRALPLVIDILNNTESSSVRQDALFLLGMSDNPEAQKAVADAVRNSDDPEVQSHAISLLAMAGDESSLELLEGMYTPDASQDVKEAVLHAYFNAEQAAPLVEILRIETDPGLQSDIIHMLGALEATEELVGIYDSLTSPETRRAAIEAFAIAGDTSKLKEILATETDPEMRMTAIQGIAISDDGESAELIRSLYDQATTVDEKRHLMEALLIMDGAEELAVQIIKTEDDPELLELAIHALAFSGSTEALKGVYDQFPDVETRRTVLEAMAIAGDTAGVKTVLNTEKDHELRVAAIHALAMNGDEETAEFLSSLYSDTSMEEKTAIIESMMILDDSKGLISLLRQEENPQLRREMMQMLSVIDSEEANEFLFEMLESKG